MFLVGKKKVRKNDERPESMEARDIGNPPIFCRSVSKSLTAFADLRDLYMALVMVTIYKKICLSQ